jgi:type IV secretory pathway VirB6-like protein
MGLLISALKMQMAGDFSGLGTQLFSTMVVSVLLNFIPDWFIEAQSFLGFTLLDNMDIDIGLIASTYVAETAVWIGIELAAAITAFTVAASGLNMFTWALLIGCVYGLIAILCCIIVGLVSGFVWVMVLAAYIMQALSTQVAIGISPLFLGMFLFPTTRETGTKYFTGMIAVLFWPLGWGIGFKLVELIMAVALTIVTACVPILALNILFAGVIDALVFVVEGMLFWTMIKKAPPLIVKAITSGSQVGAGLVGAGMASAASTVSSAISAAGSVASTAVSGAGSIASSAISLGGAAAGMAVGGPAGAAAGGAIGSAAGGMVSGAANMGAGAISGGANAAAGAVSGAGAGMAEMGSAS